MAKKRLRSLIAFCILMAVILGGGIYLRNFFLSRVREKIQSYVKYNRLHLQLIPPSLVLEGVRTVSRSPFFSARQVVIELPLVSLFKNEKPLKVYIDQPVVRISAPPARPGRDGRQGFSLNLPFALDRALVKGGEFHYAGGQMRFLAKGVSALLEQRGQTLSLKTEVEESSFLLSPERQPLNGRIGFHIENRGNRLMVRRFVFHSPGVTVKAKGILGNLEDPEGELALTLSAEMASLSRILGIPFHWEGRAEGEGELTRAQKQISLKTSFSSDDLALNKVPMDRVKGTLELSSVRGLNIELNILNRGSSESLKISYRDGKVSGEARGFHLDPILSYVSLPWPVLSPAWGTFSLDDKKFVADGEFKDESLTPLQERYPFRGQVHFTWDRKRDIAFSSPRLETSFGELGVDGRLTIGGDIDVGIQGDILDAKIARAFISQLLPVELKFPEIRGEGNARAHIGGTFSSLQLRLDFSLSPAGFAAFDAGFAEGSVDIMKNAVSGNVRFYDPLYRGAASFFSGAGRWSAEVKLDEGTVERILPNLPGLKIQLPLRGMGSGNFLIQQKENGLQVGGVFSSPALTFGPVGLKAIEGKLSWERGILCFPELAFDAYGGRVKNSYRFDIAGGLVEIDATAEKLDLASVSSRLGGDFSFNIQGKGPLEGEIASGKFAISNLRYGTLAQTDAVGEIKLRYSDGALGVAAQGNLSPGENIFSVDTKIPLSKGGLFFDIKGSISNLDLILPWQGVKGKLNYLAEVRGTPESPRVDGVLDFQGPLLPFPKFAQALNDYSGLIFIQNNKASIRSFKAKLGGGEVQGSGEVILGKGGLENINVFMEGRGVQLSLWERTRALGDASLRLIRDSSRFVLEGDVSVQKGFWRREVYEKLVFSSSPYPQSSGSPSILDDLTLNLRLKADDNVWMENSLGRIRGKFDLTISGNVKSPIVLGSLEALGGEVYFQDRRFQILRGRLNFFNPSAIEPYVDVRGETYVKDYRVTFSVTGLATQLKPEFSSSPPLPSEDVLALLALGEAFKRPYSTERSAQMSTASLLSFQITEEAQKRAEKLFSLDRIRIDPFLMGDSAEMTARLTVGKKISRDFFIYYSTNLTKQTEEIIRLEWDISNEFSLVGTRNEFGRVSFDFKIRRRF